MGGGFAQANCCCKERAGPSGALVAGQTPVPLRSSGAGLRGGLLRQLVFTHTNSLAVAVETLGLQTAAPERLHLMRSPLQGGRYIANRRSASHHGKESLLATPGHHVSTEPHPVYLDWRTDVKVRTI
jgi:hypothetical protein